MSSFRSKVGGACGGEDSSVPLAGAASAGPAEVRLAGVESKEKMYEPKQRKKLVRVLTVVAYVFFVSLAAIMLSLYYVFLWDPPKSALTQQQQQQFQQEQQRQQEQRLRLQRLALEKQQREQEQRIIALEEQKRRIDELQEQIMELIQQAASSTMPPEYDEDATETQDGAPYSEEPLLQQLRPTEVPAAMLGRSSHVFGSRGAVHGSSHHGTHNRGSKEDNAIPGVPIPMHKRIHDAVRHSNMADIGGGRRRPGA